MRNIAISLLAFLPVVMTSPSSAQCVGYTSIEIGTKRPTKVVRLPGKLFFHVSTLALDFDGSPVAYGVKDQGREDICNGLAPKAPPCTGKFQNACYKVCQQTFSAWSRQSGSPSGIPQTMCSVGLGGSNCSRPDVRLQAPPNQAYFVSETSLKTSPDEGGVNHAWLQGQAAQLDPSKVHYLVVPGSLVNKPWGVQFGDVGVAFSGKSQTPIPFIVGDGGGLGEGSSSLLAALRPNSPPQLKPATSALGNPVMRYRLGISGDFRFVIFPGTASLARGAHKVTALPAAKLTAWINATATDALKARSSRAEVLACTADLFHSLKSR